MKCLVDNIVVDISFQSLGGLCTVNFLESIDRRIDDHHLFKRSIILVRRTYPTKHRLHEQESIGKTASACIAVGA